MAVTAALLPEPLRARALDAAREIARALVSPAPVTRPPDMTDAEYAAFRTVQEASLSRGAAGFAIAFRYIAEATGDKDERSTEALSHAVDAVADPAMPASLGSGFTGIAWAVEHLDGPFGTGDDPNEEIDATLRAHVSHRNYRGDYELVGGLTGFVVYGLERLPREDARVLVSEGIKRLDERKVQTPDGFTWFTPPEMLLPEMCERYPRGVYNCGLAHGVPGVIGALARAHLAGIEQPRCRTLLEGAVSWLLAQRLPEGAGSLYPYNVVPGGEPEPARAAWCYGDPGVAAALLLASLVDSAWAAAAEETALTVAGRPPEGTGVVDACLCHGAAGLAHMCARFYQRIGDERLRDAAVAWAERTLAMASAGQGVGGFRTWAVEGWTDDPGLLQGAAGAALTLAWLGSGLDPAWDRAWLLSEKEAAAYGSNMMEEA